MNETCDLYFSVVMAVCERDSKIELRNCLDSIYESLTAHDEIILVHDGPMNDEMISFTQTYQQNNLRYFSTDAKGGLTTAINLGVKKATKKWIARMDPDDLCTADRFEQQREALVRHGFPDVLCSSILEISKYGERMRNCRLCSSGTRLPFWFINPIFNVTSVFKKSIFEAVGGYEYFPNFIDYFFWIKVWSKGYRIECMNKTTVIVRLGEDIAKRRGGVKYLISELRFYKELYKRGLITLVGFIISISFRSPMRLLPKTIRTLFWSFRI